MKDKVLVLVKPGSTVTTLACPNCQALVAELALMDVADLTDPETYAVSQIMQHQDYLGTPIPHHGRLTDGYCAKKFYVYDITGSPTKSVTRVRYATAN
jgi:hypothetical protein